jgi:hypothetical protein
MEYSAPSITAETEESNVDIRDTTECHELRNIKYKTMLLNGAPLKETKSMNDLSNLEKFLENGKADGAVNEPWCKLNKTIKTKKLLDYVEVYKTNNELTADEALHLMTFLRDCIDRKRLQRVKDVIYDKEKGVIKDIPALCYTKASKHFTLKNIDKRVSTLKSLAPKKQTHSTSKKLHLKAVDTDSEEDDEK